MIALSMEAGKFVVKGTMISVGIAPVGTISFSVTGPLPSVRAPTPWFAPSSITLVNADHMKSRVPGAPLVPAASVPFSRK